MVADLCAPPPHPRVSLAAPGDLSRLELGRSDNAQLTNRPKYLPMRLCRGPRRRPSDRHVLESLHGGVRGGRGRAPSAPRSATPPRSRAATASSCSAVFTAVISRGDTVVFDVTLERWFRPRAAAVGGPGPRAFHCAVAVDRAGRLLRAHRPHAARRRLGADMETGLGPTRVAFLEPRSRPATSAPLASPTPPHPPLRRFRRRAMAQRHQRPRHHHRRLPARRPRRARSPQRPRHGRG